MNTTNGKIAEQSKKRIANALLVALERYDYKEITITQLAGEANLSRKTFYRLFADKDDVLSYLFEDLYKVCFEQIKSQTRNIIGISFNAILIFGKKENHYCFFLNKAIFYRFCLMEHINIPLVFLNIYAPKTLQNNCHCNYRICLHTV